MSTRFTVGMTLDDGSTILSVYGHHNGLPDEAGSILRNDYRDPKKIRALLDMGDLSRLGSDIGTTNSFEDPTEGICVFYGRDRGEQDTEAMEHDDEARWLEYRAGQACKYAYLWDASEDGYDWHVIDIEESSGWR